MTRTQPALYTTKEFLKLTGISQHALKEYVRRDLIRPDRLEYRNRYSAFEVQVAKALSAYGDGILYRKAIRTLVLNGRIIIGNLRIELKS